MTSSFFRRGSSTTGNISGYLSAAPVAWRILTLTFVCLALYPLFSFYNTTRVIVHVKKVVNGTAIDFQLRTATTSTKPPAQTPAAYNMMDFIHPEKMRDPPFCNDSDPSYGMFLQNAHKNQCITYKGHDAVMRKCDKHKSVLFCVHKTLLRIQTTTGLCLGVKNSTQKEEGEAVMSFYDVSTSPKVHEEIPLFSWIPGGLLGMQLVNNNFKQINNEKLQQKDRPLCLDVLHSRRNVAVIQWMCKGKHNYKPTNQLWYWLREEDISKEQL